jgi:hypothetical protein
LLLLGRPERRGELGILREHGALALGVTGESAQELTVERPLATPPLKTLLAVVVVVVSYFLGHQRDGQGIAESVSAPSAQAEKSP